VRAVEDADDLVAVELTEMERRMLFIGLFDWGDPAYGGDSLAQALGFRDVQNLYDEGYPLAEAIGRGEPQSRRNWSRVLASFEVMFGSSVLGSGEWGAVTDTTNTSCTSPCMHCGASYPPLASGFHVVGSEYGA